MHDVFKGKPCLPLTFVSLIAARAIAVWAKLAYPLAPVDFSLCSKGYCCVGQSLFYSLAPFA
jgi:hypothetical protein